jgi:hypothetical protein
VNDFLIYAARLQDAGVCSLWISLGSNKERTRLMHVSPDSTVPAELAAKYPTRTFELDGTDRLLRDLKDEMVFGDGGATPEKLMAAIELHPLAADDLREWFADWLISRPNGDEVEITETEMVEINASAERSLSYVKGLMRGLDANREKAAR